MKNGTYAVYFNNAPHGDDALLSREISSSIVLDVVLDGVSNEQGSIASKLAVEKIKNGHIKNHDDILLLLQDANKELTGISCTTVTATLKVGNHVWAINSGDSPAYLIRGKDSTELTTLDKSPYSLAAITNCVGIGADFSCHVKEIEIQPGDKLVLLTDGISDNLYVEEIVEVVIGSNTPQETTSGIEKLLAKKKKENKGRTDMFGFFKNDDATAIVRYF